jgi:hypothetical protein
VALTPAPAAPADDDSGDALPAAGKVWENSGPSLSGLLEQHHAAQPAERARASSNIEPVDKHNLPQVWQRLLDALEARGPALHSLVSHGRLAQIEDGRAVIRYERRHETFVKMLERNGKNDTVRDLLTQVTGEPLGVKFEVDEAQAAETATAVVEPVAVRRLLAREIPREPGPAAPVSNAIRITPELKESLRNSEPLIKAIMDELGADIVKVELPEQLTTSN